MKSGPRGALVLGVLIAALPSFAEAQRRHLSESPADPFDESAWVELGVFHDVQGSGASTVRETGLPMRFGFDWRVLRSLTLRGRFGLTGMLVDTDAGDRQRTFRPGNPSLGAYYVRGRVGRSRTLAYGLGAQGTVPTAQLPSDASTADRYAASYSLANAMFGLEDAWLYVPERWALAPGGFVRGVTDWAFYSATLDFGFFFPAGGPRQSDALFQYRLEGGLRLGDTTHLGAAYTGVLLMTDHALVGLSDSERYQGALHVFARTQLESLILAAELTMNLAGPYGWAFSDGGVWSFVFRVGGPID